MSEYRYNNDNEYWYITIKFKLCFHLLLGFPCTWHPGDRAELQCLAYVGFIEDQEIVMFWTINDAYATDYSGINETGKLWVSAFYPVVVVSLLAAMYSDVKADDTTLIIVLQCLCAHILTKLLHIFWIKGKVI